METREERLQLRIAPAEKALLTRAATAAHTSLTTFVLDAAFAQAEDVLAERALFHLGTAAAAAFIEALERPAEVNDRLAHALAQPSSIDWTG